MLPRRKGERLPAAGRRQGKCNQHPLCIADYAARRQPAVPQPPVCSPPGRSSGDGRSWRVEIHSQLQAGRRADRGLCCAAHEHADPVQLARRLSQEHPQNRRGRRHHPPDPRRPGRAHRFPEQPEPHLRRRLLRARRRGRAVHQVCAPQMPSQRGLLGLSRDPVAGRGLLLLPLQPKCC